MRNVTLLLWKKKGGAIKVGACIAANGKYYNRNVGKGMGVFCCSVETFYALPHTPRCFIEDLMPIVSRIYW